MPFGFGFSNTDYIGGGVAGALKDAIPSWETRGSLVFENYIPAFDSRDDLFGDQQPRTDSKDDLVLENQSSSWDTKDDLEFAK